MTLYQCVVLYWYMKTCDHFRFLLPKEDADELRLIDNKPCKICDAKYSSLNEWLRHRLIDISKEHFDRSNNNNLTHSW